MFDPRHLGALCHFDALFARPLGRRQFLGAGLAAACAVSGLARLARADGDPTTADVLGPYYAPGAPVRNVIAAPDAPGTRLFIQGRVLAANGATPLAGTIVDVWQASDAGCYSVFEDCADEDPFNLRGQFMTGANGTYAFESVMPGYYAGRCRHIHFRIAPITGPVLVTQLYFAGDPRIAEDPLASGPEAAARIIPLTEDREGLRGRFDLLLDLRASSDAHPEESVPTATVLHPAFPNPFSTQTVLRWSQPAAGAAALMIFTAGGRRVRRLAAGGTPGGYHTAAWDGRDEAGRELVPGTYLARLETARGVRVQKLLKVS